MVLNGKVGLEFYTTEDTVTTQTGTASIITEMESAYRYVALTGAELVVGLSCSIGVTPIEIDLNNLTMLQGADYTISPVKSTNPVDITTLKVLHVVNKTASTIVTLTPAVANSFLPAGEQITINGTCANGYVSSLGTAIGINGKFTIVSDTLLTNVEIYILGL